MPFSTSTDGRTVHLQVPGGVDTLALVTLEAQQSYAVYLPLVSK